MTHLSRTARVPIRHEHLVSDITFPSSRWELHRQNLARQFPTLNAREEVNRLHTLGRGGVGSLAICGDVSAGKGAPATDIHKWPILDSPMVVSGRFLIIPQRRSLLY